MKLHDFYHALKQEIAPLDARILLCHALGLTHECLLMQDETDISPEQQALVKSFVAERLKGKPVAKILGHKEFYGRMFATTTDTLDPRPDSETLIEAVLHNMPVEKKLRVLDLGTGTGCLIITLLAERPEWNGVAVDQSAAALRIAKQNADTLDVSSRLAFLQSDWLSDVSEKFDLIISNPPYIPSAEIENLAKDVKDFDPRGALDGGADGLDPYRQILADVARCLQPHGHVCFELGLGQAPEVTALLHRYGFGKVDCFKDLGDIERVLLAKADQ